LGEGVMDVAGQALALRGRAAFAAEGLDLGLRRRQFREQALALFAVRPTGAAVRPPVPARHRRSCPLMSVPPATMQTADH
ncbi:hypothetical protein ACWGBX_36645, partial [Streptomyces sp. NPDC055037]